MTRRDNPPMPEELSPEDQKLVTLARAARARNGAAEGAAVRDGDGRTYAGAGVTLPSLTLTALQYAVAAAAAAGSTVLEAAPAGTPASPVDSAGVAAGRDPAADPPGTLDAAGGTGLGTAG